MNPMTLMVPAIALLVAPAMATDATVAPPAMPGAAFQDCDDCPDMVVLPPGRFIMGSTQKERDALGVDERFDKMESPAHPVTIGYRFAVGRYAVTFAQWDACVADGGCDGYRPDDAGGGRGRRPVINVNFANARAYVAWLRNKTGQPYRLPSEAEWEYAARAGTTTYRYWGDGIDPDKANYGKMLPGTVAVGGYPPNAFGLYEMNGNVAQWTQDCHHDGYEGAPADGSPWLTGDCQVRNVRGSAWEMTDWTVRIAQRIGDPVATLNAHLGFRVVRDLPQ